MTRWIFEDFLTKCCVGAQLRVSFARLSREAFKKRLHARAILSLSLRLTVRELASPLASLFSRWLSCLSLPARQPPVACLRWRRERA